MAVCPHSDCIIAFQLDLAAKRSLSFGPLATRVTRRAATFPLHFRGGVARVGPDARAHSQHFADNTLRTTLCRQHFADNTLPTTIVDLWDYVGTVASIHILARAAPATEESVTQDGG
eukprot:scaffold64014_cov67-Phaeocystis_antarctica.AAC.1